MRYKDLHLINPRAQTASQTACCEPAERSLIQSFGQMACVGHAPSVVGDVVPRGLGLQRPTRRKRHVVGRKRRHKHAAGPCLRDNLITRASMLISTLLYVQLGALHQQYQLRESTLAPNWPMLRVVGRTRRKKPRSKAMSAGQSHHIFLYGHICTSKYAAGSHTRAAAATRKHFGANEHARTWWPP